MLHPFYHAYGYDSVAVSGTSVPLTAALVTPAVPSLNKAEAVELSVETDSIRYTLDGVTTPTSTVGVLLAKDNYPPLTIYGYENIKNLRMIKVTNDVTVKVHYFLRTK